MTLMSIEDGGGDSLAVPVSLIWSEFVIQVMNNEVVKENSLET